jgi:S-adenosylmethionine synthetase
MSSQLFTSESVCAGHPDKIADQISDAIVDAALAADSKSRVAVETLVTTNQIILAGEVTTQGKLDYETIARQKIAELGYSDPAFNFTDQSPIAVYIHQQSPEIAVGVDNLGAGDQGMMYGFACQETKQLMPLPIALAHALAEKIDQVRKDKIVAYLRPDGKTQVTVKYENGQPQSVETVVIAVPHQEKTAQSQITTDVFEQIVTPVLHDYGFNIKPEQLIVNGTGVWHIGGPASDTGLTGRKIVVDTYGGYARVGGGAFSGKDPTKVDRSGAYAARFIAKNIVAQGLATRAEVALAYCIGQAQPVMKTVETFGTAKVKDAVLNDYIDQILDTSVAGILNQLDLRRPIYAQTAAYGHFGRSDFSWETIDLNIT